MLLKLIVVPVIYVIIDKIKERFTRKKVEELKLVLLLENAM